MIHSEDPRQTAREERRRRRPLSAWTWGAMVFVLILLAGEAAWFGKRWGETQRKEEMIHLSSPSGQGELTHGLAMTIYRGTKFQRPVLTRLVEGELRFPLTEKLGEDIVFWDMSMRLGGQWIVPRAGEYIFFLHCDDAGRVVIGDKLVHNAWPKETRAGQPSARIPLQAGTVPILIEVNNGVGGGWIGMEWAGPSLARRYLTSQDFIADPNPGVAP